MAVKIRLARRGRKKLARYDIVVADARAPRDGRFIEKIGIYNPATNPATVDINVDKAFDWVMRGAQPTDSVRSLLSYRGVMYRKHLQMGVNKDSITQEEADKKLHEWLEVKNAKIDKKAENVIKAKTDKKKIALEAESKVRQARTEALLAKKKEHEAALVAEIADKGDESLKTDEQATQEDQVTEKTVADVDSSTAEEVSTASEDKEENKSEN